MNNFVVEIWKKFNFGYRYLNSYKLSVFFKPNKVLTLTENLARIFTYLGYLVYGVEDPR